MSDQEPRIRTSKSGRVPQWVMDEALGKKVEPVPFRAAPSTSARAVTTRRRRSTATLLVVAAVAVALVIGVDHVRGSQGSGIPVASSRGPLDTTSPPAGAGEKGHRLAAAPAAPAEAEGDRYRFSGHQRGSKAPITWDPCRQIRYVIRLDNAPPGGEQMVKDSFATLGAATGLQFVSAGTTEEPPTEDRDAYQPAKYGNRWAPVLVAWATDNEVPDFGVDFAGEAGPSGLTTPSGDQTYVTGTVMLSAKDFQAFAQQGRTADARAVVLHELGHLAGLAHVPDKTQVMFPRAGAASGYGSGDLAGLAALGRGSCQPDV